MAAAIGFEFFNPRVRQPLWFRFNLSLPILVPEETLWIMSQKRPQRWGCD